MPEIVQAPDTCTTCRCSSNGQWRCCSALVSKGGDPQERACGMQAKRLCTSSPDAFPLGCAAVGLPSSMGSDCEGSDWEASWTKGCAAHCAPPVRKAHALARTCVYYARAQWHGMAWHGMACPAAARRVADRWSGAKLTFASSGGSDISSRSSFSYRSAGDANSTMVVWCHNKHRGLRCLVACCQVTSAVSTWVVYVCRLRVGRTHLSRVGTSSLACAAARRQLICPEVGM